VRNHVNKPRHGAHGGPGHQGHGGHEAEYRRRLLAVLVLSTPLLLLSQWVRPLLGLGGPKPLYAAAETALMLAIYLYGGLPFLKGAVEEARRLRPGMMTLVSLGISSAALYGVYEFLAGEEPSMALEMAFLVLVMLAGHWAEMKYSMRAAREIEALASLVPSMAHLLEGGAEREVPVSSLKPGDTVVVRPGERVPVDGVVVEGEALVDESLLTGESRPVYKGPGSRVVGGSLLVNGSLTVRAEKTGESTYVSQVVRLVREARETKTRIQTLADKGASVLTFTALGVGLASLVYWAGVNLGFAVERMVSVLVAACPHALGVGVPLAAIIVSLRGARRGILVRNRRAFERAAMARIVAFDKTGTLTRGELVVKGVEAYNGYSLDEVLLLAASVERVAEHPIARALLEYAEARGVKPVKAEGFRLVSGVGVRGLVEGKEVYVGGPALLRSLGVEAGEGDEQGVTVYVVVEGAVAGKVVLEDTMREEAFEAVERLRRMGVRTVMLTGDRRREAERVAAELGIDEVYAELKPEEKVGAVERLKAGGVVVMVGDGINDAPALTAADVGIAIGAGTQVAIESADVVLVGSDPRGVPESLELSRSLRRKMLGNVAWALAYNTSVMLLASGALAGFGLVIDPALGALAMTISDIVAAAISLR